MIRIEKDVVAFSSFGIIIRDVGYFSVIACYDDKEVYSLNSSLHR